MTELAHRLDGDWLDGESLDGSVPGRQGRGSFGS